MENVLAGKGTTLNVNRANEKNRSMDRRQAFVFITAEPDSSKSAIEELKKVDGIVELYPLGGAYDIIAKVSGESLEHLREVVFKQMRNLGSITSILTLMVV